MYISEAYFSTYGFLGFLYFLICLVAAFLHSHRARKFQAIDVSSISMGLVYGIMMPIVASKVNGIEYIGKEILLESSNVLILHTAVAVLGVAGIYVGWLITPKIIRKHALGLFNRINPNEIIRILYALLIISFIAMFLYVHDYGGFMGYFSFNRLIRSGVSEEYDMSSFSYLLPFGKFSFIAFFGFYGLIQSKIRTKSTVIGLLIAFVFSQYMLLANAGRLPALAFWGIFLIALFSSKILQKSKFWGFALVIFPPIGVWVLFEISRLFELNMSDSILSFAIKESSFIVVSFFAQLHNGYLFDMFYEMAVWPAYLLPSSATHNWLTNASDINTALIMGSKKGEGGVTGAIPVDLLTFGLMQMHFFGVFICSLIFGLLLRLAIDISNSFSAHGLSHVFSIYVTINFGMLSIFYFYPKYQIVGYFPVFVLVISYISYIAVKAFLFRASK